MTAWVYILASRYRGTLYTGVTNDLPRRWEHREAAGSTFTSRYNIFRLVYAEQHERIDEARVREQRIKRWRRAWKFNLIEESNAEWLDLLPTSAEVAGSPPSRGKAAGSPPARG